MLAAGKALRPSSFLFSIRSLRDCSPPYSMARHFDPSLAVVKARNPGNKPIHLLWRNKTKPKFQHLLPHSSTQQMTSKIVVPCMFQNLENLGNIESCGHCRGKVLSLFRRRMCWEASINFMINCDHKCEMSLKAFLYTNKKNYTSEFRDAIILPCIRLWRTDTVSFKVATSFDNRCTIRFSVQGCRNIYTIPKVVFFPLHQHSVQVIQKNNTTTK